jgi:hypothetical protein
MHIITNGSIHQYEITVVIKSGGAAPCRSALVSIEHLNPGLLRVGGR